MSSSQILKEELEEFDKRFGKRGPDGNCDSIGRRAGCDDCVENVQLREEHKEFVAEILTTHTLNILKAERERLQKQAQKVIRKKNSIQNDSFHPARCQYLGQQDAIKDQISYLDQEIKKIEEKI